MKINQSNLKYGIQLVKNDIVLYKCLISKTKKSKERLSLQKSSNLQEIDDFLVVLDNSEEYKKMILEQAKNKVRRVIRKIKETKDINKLMNDLTETKKYIITPDNKLMPYFNYLIFILLYIDIIISPFEYFVYCNPTAKIKKIEHKLIKKLGEGTFSELFKAQNIKTGIYISIKCLKSSFDNIEQVNNLREV